MIVIDITPVFMRGGFFALVRTEHEKFASEVVYWIVGCIMDVPSVVLFRCCRWMSYSHIVVAVIVVSLLYAVLCTALVVGILEPVQ